MFALFAVFCLLVWALVGTAVVWLVLELLPHITGALDRAGQ